MYFIVYYRKQIYRGGKEVDIYRSVFFICIACHFKLSLLGSQNNYKVVGTCPCCDGDLTYMDKTEREAYLKELKDELKYM